MIKNKSKELLSELNQRTLFLECKKKNSHKIFCSRVKLIASDLDVDEVFNLIYQIIARKKKKTMLVNIGLSKM